MKFEDRRSKWVGRMHGVVTLAMVGAVSLGCGGSEAGGAADEGSAMEEQVMARDEAEAASGGDAAPEDVESVDAIIAALYDAISFEPGGGPDWDRLRTLFHPDGRLVPPRNPETDELPVLTVEEFIEASTGFIEDGGLREQGFHEVEVERELETFGAIAHAWSTYESRYRESDDEPFSSGINSIQMVRDDARWWVLHIVWDVFPE